jgi:hypothetical protein
LGLVRPPECRYQASGLETLARLPRLPTHSGVPTHSGLTGRLDGTSRLLAQHIRNAAGAWLQFAQWRETGQLVGGKDGMNPWCDAAAKSSIARSSGSINPSGGGRAYHPPRGCPQYHPRVRTRHMARSAACTRVERFFSGIARQSSLVAGQPRLQKWHRPRSFGRPQERCVRSARLAKHVGQHP